MQTITYERNPELDRSKWPAGPWDDEPDKVQWQDETTGLPCLVVRQHWGVWCGYVGVTDDHPLYRQGYEVTEGGWDDDTDERVAPNYEVVVHGGLTFASSCVDEGKEYGICHRPDPGEPDDVWWFGFDCGHGGRDIMPGLPYTGLLGGMPGETYKTLDFAQDQCRKLALQLKAMMS